MDESLAFNETCSGTKFHVYWYHGYCVTHLQQEVEEEEKEEEEGEEEEKVEHGQNVKIHLSITLDISDIFVKYLVYTFVSTCFVMEKC